MLLLPLLVQMPTIYAPTPARIAAYDVVEFGVEAGHDFANPFDPDEIAVDGTFTQGKSRLTLPAYWDGAGFRLRFCPPKPGKWTLNATVATAAGVTHALIRRFDVAPSKAGGFVRPSPANPRYFALDDSRSFVPVGLNLCWPDRDGLASYDRRFSKLSSVGGNFARIWTTQDRRLETKLGRYDETNAAFYDGVFRLATKHGIRTMLTFDDYRVLAKSDYFNAHWTDSPYNAANGGPLKEPTDFFADPLCRKLYKRRLRYLVARYAAFPSLAFWELYNEQDNIPKPGVPTEWFREMTATLRSLDPYDHPITTSYSWDDKAEVWQSPALGLTQRHLYGQGDTVDFVSMIEENSRKLDRFGKPRLIGEFGITWKEPDVALDKARLGTPLHDALWASIMTGDAGGALTWWWDNYLEPLDLWPVFTGISRFVAPIDFAHRDFRPLALKIAWSGRAYSVERFSEGRHEPKLESLSRGKPRRYKPLASSGILTLLGMQDAKTGETILWLHDPASNWKDDATGTRLTEWTGTTVAVPANRTMTAEVWDTRKGEVFQRSALKPTGGNVTVKLPPFRRDVAVRLY